MKLIEYEEGSKNFKDVGFVTCNNLTVFQVSQLEQWNDIAHSLSIMAETMSAQYKETQKRPRYEDITQEDIDNVLSGKIRPPAMKAPPE